VVGQQIAKDPIRACERAAPLAVLAVAVNRRGERRCALAVPRQHKLDSLWRLRKRGFLVHLNRKRSGDEIESGYAFG
jgi:hypothetical protein